MKKLILTLIIFFSALGIKTEARNYRFRNHEFGVTFNYFYETLAPYGEWIRINGDLVVWRPRVLRRGWSPYSDGRWVWTEYGWYWDSYEPFGWAVYHYGRWVYDDYYGWIWVPDYQWAPAWVEWRYDDEFIGWAPLPPYASFDIYVGIRFSYGWHAPYIYWHFVDYPHFCVYNVNNYYIGYERVRSILPRTRYRTDYYYRDGRIINYGVDRSYVERRSGRRIVKADVRITSRRSGANYRGSNRNVVTVFRPSAKEVRATSRISNVKIKRAERTSIKVNRIAVGKRKVTVRKNETVIRKDIGKTKRIDMNKRPSGNRSTEIIRERRTIKRKPDKARIKSGTVYPSRSRNKVGKLYYFPKEKREKHRVRSSEKNLKRYVPRYSSGKRSLPNRKVYKRKRIRR